MAAEPLATRHGYVEYRVQLKNTSNEDCVVYLNHPGRDDRSFGNGLRVSRTVSVAAGQEVLVSLYEQPSEVFYGLLEVQVDGGGARVRASPSIVRTVGGLMRPT